MKYWTMYHQGFSVGTIGSDWDDTKEEVQAAAERLTGRKVDVQPVYHIYEAPQAAPAPTTDTGFILETRKFLKDLLDRDMFHYAVSDEVRREARRLLGDEIKK